LAEREESTHPDGLDARNVAKSGAGSSVKQRPTTLSTQQTKGGLAMKYALTLFALLTGGIGVMAVTTSEPAHAVVYCQYIDYPANCIVRPGARLVARPVARAAVRSNASVNRGGPVNRAGRR
jgi:hypothetical protein